MASVKHTKIDFVLRSSDIFTTLGRALEGYAYTLDIYRYIFCVLLPTPMCDGSRGLDW
jgi:hypothetical protein